MNEEAGDKDGGGEGVKREVKIERKRSRLEAGPTHHHTANDRR